MALVVFTGGARSGKSAAAQSLAQQRSFDGPAVTVAVFGRPSDDEMAERVRRHRQQRPASFSTLEVVDPRRWLDEVPAGDVLLVDCLGTFLGLAMEHVWRECARAALEDAERDVLPAGLEEALLALVEPLVESIIAREGDTIVVTNETGMGVVPEWASARLFRDMLGLLNRRFVSAADAAYLCVCGRLIDLATLPSQVAWPED